MSCAIIAAGSTASAQDPIAHWTFDEVDAGLDVAGSHNGTLQNGASVTSIGLPPILGNVGALNLVALNQHMTVPHVINDNYFFRCNDN